jgi:uncharacterized protein YbaR (Trm112 family)
MISKEFLDVLACPKCKGPVKYEKNKLICKKCRLKFSVIDDIPNMLIEEAEKF